MEAEDDQAHVGDKHEKTGDQVDERNRNELVEDLQHRIAFRFHCEEVICSRIESACPDENIYQEDAESNYQQGKDCLRKVLVSGAVQPECHKGDCRDEHHEMRSVETDDSGHVERISRKTHARHGQSHCGTQCSGEETETHQGPVFAPYSDRNENHVYVAHMQREFSPPVESAHGCIGNGIVFHVDGKEIFVNEEFYGRNDAGDGQNIASGLFFLIAEKNRRNDKKGDEETESTKVYGIEWSNNPETLFRHGDSPFKEIMFTHI